MKESAFWVFLFNFHLSCPQNFFRRLDETRVCHVSKKALGVEKLAYNTQVRFSGFRCGKVVCTGTGEIRWYRCRDYSSEQMKPNCIYDPPNYSEYYPGCCHRLYCPTEPTQVIRQSVPPSPNTTTQATHIKSTIERKTASAEATLTTSNITKEHYHKEDLKKVAAGKKNLFENNFKIALKNAHNKTKFPSYEIKVRLANFTNSSTTKGKSKLKLVIPENSVENTVKVLTNSTYERSVESKAFKESQTEEDHGSNKIEEDDNQRYISHKPVRYKRYFSDYPTVPKPDYSSYEKINMDNAWSSYVKSGIDSFVKYHSN